MLWRPLPHIVAYPKVMDVEVVGVRELARQIAGLAKLSPVARARRARELVGTAKAVLSAAADAAVVEATRTMSYQQVARELGRSVASVNKAVSRHRARHAES